MIFGCGLVGSARALFTGLIMGAAVMASDVAYAQSNNDVANRITRLEVEIRDLQRHLFAGKTKPTPAISSTTVQETTLTPKGGGEEASSGAAARTEIRLQQLEAQMRNLTGKVEELDFKITQLVGRTDTLVSDLDRRFSAIDGLAKSSGSVTSSVAGSGGGGSSVASPRTTDGAAQSDGLFAPAGSKETKKAGVLGYLNEGDLRKIESARRDEQASEPGDSSQVAVAPSSGATRAAENATAQASGPILPAGDPATQYKHAFSYLMRHDYDTAEKAFREFVDGNGADPLAGNAMYWLGETYYVREMFAESAVTFAEGYENYPGSPKTADNLLKLGFSLARLRRTEDACVALAQLKDEFPNASATIKRQTLIESKRIGCKG
jgi:tol-pal system protein YbgF